MQTVIATLAPYDNGWYKDGMPMPAKTIGVNHAARIGMIPNQDSIRDQHRGLVDVLRNIPKLGIMDLPFPNNNEGMINDNVVFIRDAFLSNGKDKILISRFRNPTRMNQAEMVAEMIKNKLGALGISRDIVAPPNEEGLFFEGGDFRYVPNDNLLFVGYNPDRKTSRNSESGIAWVQKELDIPDENRILVHAKGFHIDTVLGLVTDVHSKVVACLACPDLISNYGDFQKQCKSIDIEVIPLDRKYGIHTPDSDIQGLGTVNTLNVNEYLLSGGWFDEKTEKILENIGVKRIVTDVSEFWLAGGGIHCLTNQI